MGVSFARSLSDIYLNEMEEKTLPPWKENLLGWLRWIDDIFGIWDGSMSELLEFVELLNKMMVIYVSPYRQAFMLSNF